MLSYAIKEVSSRELDYKLAFYCAPVIAGIKPANIISIKKPISFSLEENLARIARPLGAKGIYFYHLTQCPRRVLLIVYNRQLLKDSITRPGCMALLLRYGYRPDDSLDALLRRLSRRICENHGFPHEIGVFLGYPLRDVEGFIQNRGRNFRLCGYWKVYGNEEEAKRIFSVYDSARNYFCQRVADGEEIYNITYGGTAV